VAEKVIYIKEENFDANAIVISKLQGLNIGMVPLSLIIKKDYKTSKTQSY
jgi:hypothetical protein